MAPPLYIALRGFREDFDFGHTQLWIISSTNQTYVKILLVTVGKNLPTIALLTDTGSKRLAKEKFHMPSGVVIH